MPLTEQQRQAAVRILASIDPRARVPWMERHEEIGRWLWPHTYARSDDDVEAMRRLVEFVRSLPDSHPDKCGLLDRCEVPAARHDLIMSALWTHCANPVVQVSHRWAAAAICTSLPENYELRAPWRSFMILVPDRLLPLAEPETGRELWVSHALVETRNTERGQLWTVVGMLGDSHTQCGTRAVSTAQLLSEYRGDGERSALQWPIDRATDRVIMCLRTLCANVLVAMTDADSCKPVGKHPVRWTSGPKPGGEPGHRTFAVGKPVTIDVRREVTEYCRGGVSRTPTVASLVRGFWRRQPHGPERSLRRLQFIEPHWRNADATAIRSPRVKVGD